MENKTAMEMAEAYEREEYERAARVAEYERREFASIPEGEYRTDDRPVRSICEEARS